MRYGLRLNTDEKYMGLKKQLSELCRLKPEQILLTEVHTSNIKVRTRSRKRRQKKTSGLCFFSFPLRRYERQKRAWSPKISALNSGSCVSELSSGQPEGAAVR